MRRRPASRPLAAALAALPLVAGACSSSPAAGPAQDVSCAGPCPASSIKHVVIVVQENHTFDDHFGGYCTAPAGSSPSCNAGPSCCEAAPASDPSGHAPVRLDDAAMAARDPDHSEACEAAEIDGGKMDAFVTAPCGAPENVALADPAVIRPYWDLAAKGALADRYFQPLVGQSSANDMVLARARYVFSDNDVGPKGAVGMTCGFEGAAQEYTDPTIGDLLTGAGVPWTFYAEGYGAMAAAVTAGRCPPKPQECRFALPLYPCVFDPSDVPFEYYPSTRDNAQTMKDLSALFDALDGGGLPAVSFVKAIGYKSEHPGHGTKLSDGVAFVTDVIDRVQRSRYASATLVLLTYDEGGGYFDHVAPPPPSAVDGKAYGTRVPLLAVGPFAKPGFVSHVTMEHSSIVKFLEWNWLGGATGQLQGRDGVVANLGSLLDPAKTGAPVPEQ